MTIEQLKKEMEGLDRNGVEMLVEVLYTHVERAANRRMEDKSTEFEYDAHAAGCNFAADCAKNSLDCFVEDQLPIAKKYFSA